MKRRIALFVIPAVLLFADQYVEAAQNVPSSDEAIQAVAAVLPPPTPGAAPNKLAITADDLRSMDNPLGDGTFVYAPQTEYWGVERLVVWLVLDDQVFPINGATKSAVTPELPFLRETPQDVWQQSGLGPYGSASEVIKIVFEEQ